MSITLSNAQNRFLRGQAHGLKAMLQIGAKGLTDAVVAEIENALEHHELIKVKVSAEDRDARFTPNGFDAGAGNGARAEGLLNAREKLGADSERGLGEASQVFFNPTIKRSDGPRPAFIGLAHELVHADRNQFGLAIDRQGVNGIHALKDELETVGLIQGPQQASENSIRDEHGIAPRTSYAGQTRLTYVQALRALQQQRQQAQAPHGDGTL